MRITFEEEDEEFFFNMVSSQRVYADIAEKYKIEDLDVPYSTIDILINKLAKTILDKKLYQISFEEDYEKVLSMISFMLGTGIWKFEAINPYWKFFKQELPSMHDFIEISKEMLWEELKKNGIEI